MRKLIAIMLFGIFLVPLVIVLRDHRNKEYDCLTPEEIDRRCRKYDEYWEVTWSQ